MPNLVSLGLTAWVSQKQLEKLGLDLPLGLGTCVIPYKHARPHRGCRARTVKVGFKAYGFLV